MIPLKSYSKCGENKQALYYFTACTKDLCDAETSISVFISYARKDAAFTDRLEADLQARNFRTWVDRRKLEGGQEWLDERDHTCSH